MAHACYVCGAPAVSAIPDGRVCRTHAIEFWTQLLAYASAQPRVPEPLATAFARRIQRWRDGQTAA